MSTIGVIAWLIVAAIIACLFGALLVAIVGAMFLHTPFGDSWDYAWDNPFKLLVFVVFLLPFFAQR